eukprot:6060802-Prymnesium_polylepis.1
MGRSRPTARPYPIDRARPMRVGPSRPTNPDAVDRRIARGVLVSGYDTCYASEVSRWFSGRMSECMRATYRTHTHAGSHGAPSGQTGTYPLVGG